MSKNIPLAAPSARSTDEEIRAERKVIENAENIGVLLDNLPYITLILDKNRQIIYGNDKLQDVIKGFDLKAFIGMRPGEALCCVHAEENNYGCGCSGHCRFCGAGQTILKCLKQKQPCTSEAVVTVQNNNHETIMDLRVTCTPLSVGEVHFVLMSLVDICAEKHKERLERVFFHDIINTAGGLLGLLSVMDKSKTDFDNYADMFKKSIETLIDEVKTQKDLNNAEAGILEPQFTTINCCEFIDSIVTIMSLYPSISKHRKIIKSPCSEQIAFSSDAILARRVIMNMLKNALEATPKGKSVELGCFSNENNVVFTVKNDGVMKEEVQNNIFQRSFSTKSTGRGIGTYSIKLFMENYLKGKVYFISDEYHGTIFYAEFPKSL
jgi:signal transduction histidine kinase